VCKTFYSLYTMSYSVVIHKKANNPLCIYIYNIIYCQCSLIMSYDDSICCIKVSWECYTLNTLHLFLYFVHFKVDHVIPISFCWIYWTFLHEVHNYIQSSMRTIGSSVCLWIIALQPILFFQCCAHSMGTSNLVCHIYNIVRQYN